MILKLKPYSEKPLYEQVIQEIKRGITTGELAPGEALPSVRSLASDIGINMHTVNKVYKQMQSEGLLQKTKSGFSVTVAIPPKPTPSALEAFRERLYEAVLEKNLYGISQDEMLAMIADIEQELFEGGNN